MDKKEDILEAIRRGIQLLKPIGGVEQFFEEHKSLKQIGICDGMTIFIDEEISKVEPDYCVLTNDTLDTVLKELDRNQF